MKKRLILFALAILLASAVPFIARADGMCGEAAEWTLSEAGLLTVSGSGEASSAPWEKEAVRAAVIGEGITLFDLSGCINLRTVTLPQGLEAVPDYAFSGCSSLLRIDLPDSVKIVGASAFSGCTQLKSARLPPSGLLTVGNYAFENCESLLSLTLPDGLSDVSFWSFMNCPAVLYASVGSEAAKAVSRAFCTFRPPFSKIDLQYGFSESGEINNLFLCGFEEGISTLVVPDGVTCIPERLFYDNSDLTAVILPDSLAVIGPSAFSHTCLAEITLPAGLKMIGGSAFSSVKTQLHFLGDAPQFGEDAFRDSTLIVTYPAGAAGWEEASADTFGADFILWTDAEASVPADPAKDPTEALVPALTENENNHSYAIMGNGGIASSLEQQADGTWLRVESTGSAVVAEQYTDSLQLEWKKTLPMELPLWGGYFHGARYRFLVYGQENPEEDDAKEVLRVVRYSENWHRIDSVSVRGARTVCPFDAGTLRMAESGDNLFIHTSHTMYADSSGVNHQSNMSYRIYIPSMTLIRESENEVNQNDYVSHSYSQFVITDGDDLIKLDHGDANPRGLILLRQSKCAMQAAVPYGERISVLDFVQPEGRPYQLTGASAGGLEASDTCYLVVGESMNQVTGEVGRHNVFVTSVPKDNLTEDAIVFRWITDYKEAQPQVTTPFLVKVSGKRFLLLWTEYDPTVPGPFVYTLKYLFLDQAGAPASGIYSAPASLSDCAPVVSGHKVVWYVTRNDLCFYEIDLENPSSVRTVMYGSGGALAGEGSHDLFCVSEGAAATCTADGVEAYWQCRTCGKLFSDAEGKTEIPAPVITAARDHTGSWKLVGMAETGWLFTDEYERTCTVCGKKDTKHVTGSRAELIGDVNHDAVVDGRDVVRLMKYLSGEEEDAEIDEPNADVNMDNKVDEKDLLRLMQVFVGEDLDPNASPV